MAVGLARQSAAWLQAGIVNWRVNMLADVVRGLKAECGQHAVNTLHRACFRVDHAFARAAAQSQLFALEHWYLIVKKKKKDMYWIRLERKSRAVMRLVGTYLCMCVA